MTAPYGWLFRETGVDPEAKPIEGPHDMLEPTGSTAKFRMLDDDGEVYGEGLIWGEYDGFEPLDDYGTPGLGCTTIQYLNSPDPGWHTL